MISHEACLPVASMYVLEAQSASFGPLGTGLAFWLRGRLLGRSTLGEVLNTRNGTKRRFQHGPVLHEVRQGVRERYYVDQGNTQ